MLTHLDKINFSNKFSNLKVIKDGYKGILEGGKRMETEYIYNNQN